VVRGIRDHDAGPADRIRFYDIARGSAHECGAVWDVARLLRVIDDEAFVRGKALLHRVVSMLVKMAEVRRT
jgi:four helix bundle protein